MRATLALVAAICAILIGLGGASGSTPARGVARFRSVQVEHSIVGRGAGAMETWRTQVLLPNKNRIVGTGAWVCTFVDAHTSIRECMATYILPRGRVQIAGEVIDRSAFLLSIIGGTGAYSGALGVAVFRGTDEVHNLTFFLQ